MSLTSRLFRFVSKRLFLCLSVSVIFMTFFAVWSQRSQTAELGALYRLADSPFLALIAPAPSESNTAVAEPVFIAPSGAVPYDFDGDGKTDIGRWHGANTEYKVFNSGGSTPTITTIGTSGAKPISGDFDNDNKYDAGTYANGSWSIKQSSNGSTLSATWGTTGDIPVAGDFDGNGKSDCAVFRPSTTTWWIAQDCTGTYTYPSYGASTDVPVPGDYDGDSKTDLAVFRPSTGYWYASLSSGGSLAITWGISTDVPMSADFDGDLVDDLVVFRPSSGTWYVLYSEEGFTTYGTQVWGNWYDQPVPGDYDGDGTADHAIWRPTTGEWWIKKSSGGNVSYSLGVPGDVAIPSAFIKQIGGTAAGSELAASRLDPENATGGTDYYSRNFSWGTSLVGLPGRAGLDAGLGIGYNSLVWIKTSGSMYFDPDTSNVSPGFRMGFPTIEPIYYNDTRSKWAYMMVTPSGKRVEFLETSVDETFETTDSSYTQLKTDGGDEPNDPVEEISMTVKTTDGTQMTYSWNTGAYRCTRIMDRNGNYIDITYSAYGQLETITDTLVRVINVNYDGYGRVSTITQTWKTNNGADSNTTHTYATLNYTTKTVATSWSVPFYGPPNDTAVTVLDKITYADSSATKFEYNGYIQVKKVTNVAADTTTNLNYVETDLADVSGSQSDVPRMGETRNWAKDFNGGTAVEVTNSTPSSSSYDIGGYTGTATKIDVGVTGHPDSLFTRYWFHSSGWKKGLLIGTEDCVSSGCTGTDRKRWTWNDWTQDNESVSYILNPRMEDSKVGDGTNTKRTSVEYYEPSTGVFPYGLPKKVKAYDTDGTTILKTQVTEYNLGSNYTDKRIIGLPSESRLYQGSSSSGTLMSKVTFGYDEGAYTDSSQNVSSPTKHDSTYGTSFQYRGNRTSVTRWDVTDDNNDDLISKSSVVYNILGMPILQKDARDRETTISYTDTTSWNDGVSRTTYAYPTTISDANGNPSTIRYRFDTGANVWAQSPMPSGSENEDGKTTSREFSDTTGRLTKQIIENTGAYTKYIYSNTGNAMTSYSTIINVDGDGNLEEDEVATETVFDGAGRVLKTRTENPGSTGGYTGKKVEYDILGRAFRETVPTEIDSSWEPDGDDDRGSGVWLWNTTEFDWKGRTTRTIPSDSNGSDDKDTLITYEGCGCAGGQVTTIKGPKTTAIDATGNSQTTKRRTQKIYADILGRTAKTEVWDLDGAGMPSVGGAYSTTVNTYNGRDQVTNVRQYSGGTSSGTYQDTTMSYDGHGRPYQVHKPEWFESSTLKYQTTTYNADDTVATVTDPRGTVTTFKYGHVDEGTGSEYRALPTKIEYSVPGGSAIPDPADVSFTYDAAGNRTSMAEGTGGTGTLTYTYDELSRLETETKDFTDYLANAPDGVYTLTYNYHLSGGIKSIEDPFGDEITYTPDKIGRTTGITGTEFAGLTSYASYIRFRAFGSLRSMTTSTDSQTDISFDYDTALRPSAYAAASAANETNIHDRAFSYYNDGTLHEITDNVDAKYSQKNEYDFAARLKKNDFGNSTDGIPYHQSLGYDAFDHITARSTWDKDDTERSYTAGFVNNRKTSGGYQSGTDTYNNSGQVVENNIGYENKRTWKFDAAGRTTEWLDTVPLSSVARDEGGTITFDGDGRPAKKVKRARDRNYTSTWTEETEYTIFSSVTGAVISTTNTTGRKTKTNVYLNGSVIAEQIVSWFDDDPTESITFKNVDPLSGGQQDTTSAGEIIPENENGGKVELEPLGAWINAPEGEVVSTSGNFKDWGRIDNPQFGCSNKMFGFAIPCDAAAFEANYEAQFSDNFGLKCYNYFGYQFCIGGMKDNDPKIFPPPRGADNVEHDTPGLMKQYYKTIVGETLVEGYEWVAAPGAPPPDIPTIEQFKDAVNTKWAAKVTECAKKLYRKWALKQRWGSAVDRSRAIDSVDARPEFNLTGVSIDATLTAKALAKKYKIGVVPYAIPTLDGKGYTIRVGSEFWNDSKQFVIGTNPTYTDRSPMENAYVHEYGNIVAHYLTGDWYAFGKKASDPDSGYQVQLCVFGN